MSENFELNERLQTHSDLLLQTGDAFQEADDKATRKGLEYDVARAQALLSIRTDKAFSGFTVAEKEAEVTRRCEEQMIAAKIAQSEVRSLKMRAETVNGSLSALQSQVKLALADHTMDKWRT